MQKEILEKIFDETGFDEHRLIKTSDIIISQDVFNQCARNTCGCFGKNHGCPPSAGTEDERRARIMKYSSGYFLNKIVPMPNARDPENSMPRVLQSINALRDRLKGEDVMILGAGPCMVCERCAALDDEPCRFPDKVQYSMEANGIDVVRMSMQQKMTYNAGGGKIGYFTLVLFNEA